MRPFDLVLSRTPSPLALQQTPLLDPSASRAQFKICYLAWLRVLISTASRNLLAGQERYMQHFDNRIRYPIHDYQIREQVLVNREAALRSEEKTEKDWVNNKLAPRTESPFSVLQMDDHTFTILRRKGLKDRLSRYWVVKSLPLQRNVEEPRPGPWRQTGNMETSPALRLQRGPSLH